MRSPTAASRPWTTWGAVSLLAVLFVLLLRGVASPPSSERGTSAAVPEGPGLQVLMEAAGAGLDLLSGQSEDARRRTMRIVVDLFRDGLAPHVEAEPLQGHGGEAAVLAVEHEILRRWLLELEDLSAAPLPDTAFVRRAQRLLGLVEAHLEVEARFRREEESSLAGR